MIDRTVSFEETMDLLDKAVMDRGPEWKYPSAAVVGEELGATCVYFNDPQDLGPQEVETLEKSGVFQHSPACLVGDVFHRLGITPAAIEGLNQSGVNELRDSKVVSFDSKAWDLLYVVQSCQDVGISWGDSVEFAKSLSDDDMETVMFLASVSSLLKSRGWVLDPDSYTWIKPE